MLHFYVVMLRISIEPRHLVGYTSCFESISKIICVQGYTVSIEVYGVWSSKTIILSCFRQIRSEYHPEFGESVVGDKYHQMIFLIRCINRSSVRTFDVGPNSAFG